MEQNNYCISNVCELVNKSTSQIKFWENQGYIPKAQRLMVGKRAYRHYAQEDVEKIKTFVGYLDQGLTLKAAAAKLTTIMEGK